MFKIVWSKKQIYKHRIPSPVANVVPYNATLGEDYHEAFSMAGFKVRVFSSSEPDREVI